MSTKNYSAAAEVAHVRTRRTWLHRMWLGLRKAPLTAWFGLLVILGYLFCMIFADLIAPHGEAQVFAEPYAAWSETHLLGTDQLGRDILSRLIYGARNTVGIALLTTLLSFVIGGGLGLAAAINRSWLDQILSRFVDILLAIPSLIFALMLLAVFETTSAAGSIIKLIIN